MLQVLTTRQAAKLKRMVKGHAGAHAALCAQVYSECSGGAHAVGEGAACEEAQAARVAALSERCSARVTPCLKHLTTISKICAQTRLLRLFIMVHDSWNSQLTAAMICMPWLDPGPFGISYGSAISRAACTHLRRPT